MSGGFGRFGVKTAPNHKMLMEHYKSKESNNFLIIAICSPRHGYFDFDTNFKQNWTIMFAFPLT